MDPHAPGLYLVALLTWHFTTYVTTYYVGYHTQRLGAHAPALSPKESALSERERSLRVHALAPDNNNNNNNNQTCSCTCTCFRRRKTQTLTQWKGCTSTARPVSSRTTQDVSLPLSPRLRSIFLHPPHLAASSTPSHTLSGSAAHIPETRRTWRWVLGDQVP